MIENRPYPPGQIAEMAVMQSKKPNSRAEFRQRFQGLLTGFPDPVKFYWLHPGENSFDSFSEGRHEIVPVPLGKGKWNDTWIQDPIHIATSHDGAREEILIPVHSPEEDWKIVRHLALAANITIRPTNFYFQGGNLLQIGDWLFCGKDLMAQNEQIQNQHSEIGDLKKEIIEACRVKHLVCLGTETPFSFESLPKSGHHNSSQPFFHLDLFILPLGITPAGQIQIGLGEIHPDFQIGIPDHGIKDLKKLHEALETVGRQLTSIPDLSVEIVRIPVLLGMNGRMLQLYSHCNGYVDVLKNTRIAILPEYLPKGNHNSIWKDRFRRLQDDVEQRLLSHGIRSRFVDGDFLRQANDCGALHCRTKVIRYKK